MDRGRGSFGSESHCPNGRSHRAVRGERSGMRPCPSVACGRQGHEGIVPGEVSGQRAIAERLGLNEGYVGRVLECAFVAPDIVEAILDARQPPDLTIKKLTHGLPLSWIEQHQPFGSPSLHPSATPSR